jgi:dihydroorotase-like cyclic amidohydrolase
VRFASFLSGGFTTMAVMNTTEKKLEKRTSVQWVKTIIETEYHS